MTQTLHYRKLPVLALLLSLLFLGGTAMAQKTWTGAVDNNWNTGGNWAPVGVPAIGDAVTIGTTVSITVNAGINDIGSLTISGGATVGITPAAAAATIRLNTVGAALDIQAGSRLNVFGRVAAGTNTMSLIYAGGGAKTGTIAGTLSVNGAAGGGGDDLGIFTANNSVTTVSGTLRKALGTINSGVATLVIDGTGTYLHAMNGGALVTASWNFGSTVNIAGVTTNAPSALSQTYTNFIWNCGGQSVDQNLYNPFPAVIPGNFTIANTGTAALILPNNGVNRSLTVSGNFTQTGGTFILDNANGGCSLTVDGTLQIGGTGNLVISGGTGIATVNANGPFTVSGGTLTMSTGAAQGILNTAGNFTHSSGTIIETSTGSGLINFVGTTAQTFASGTGTVSGDIRYDVATGATLQTAAASTVVSSSGGSFTLNTGATLGIRSAAGINLAGASGSIQVAGIRDYSPTANYTYNGTAAQNTGDGIPLNLTGTLTIANLAGVTLNSPEAIGSGGNIVLQSGAFNTGTNLTLNTVSTITRANGSVTGTFQGTGDYNVVYTGQNASGAELQGGQGVSNTLNNLTINLPTSSSYVSLSAETRVKGLLTLTNGKMTTTATNLLVLTSTATSGGGSQASFVSGPVRKQGTAAFVFPIGSGVGADYRPSAISGSGASIGAALSATAEVTATVSLANPLKIFNKVFLPDLLSVTNCLWWNIERTGGTGDIFVWLSTGDAGATQNVNFISGCFGGSPTATVTPANLRVAHYETGQWTSLGNASQVQQNNAWFIGAGTGIAAFSPFTVGSSENVLPVTFSAFSALKDGGSVKLSWETSSEQNSAYYDVERSSDGVNYGSIGKVTAAGNSATTRKYAFTDNNPAPGRNFYRLRQVDLDGLFDYSKTISVNMSATTAVSIYPNPAQSDVTIEYPKVGRGANYKVIGVDGRVMLSGSLQENSSQQRINMTTLQRGNYILLIQNDGQQYQQKIVKL